jgi:hypothetical protein
MSSIILTKVKNTLGSESRWVAPPQQICVSRGSTTSYYPHISLLGHYHIILIYSYYRQVEVPLEVIRMNESFGEKNDENGKQRRGT